MILSLWVPNTLYHQAISWIYAASAVAPPDAEVVQVGDPIGQRPERPGLVQVR